MIAFLAVILSISFLNNIKAEENDELNDIIIRIENINKDLKTLEKAFYKTSEIKPSTTSSN